MLNDNLNAILEDLNSRSDISRNRLYAKYVEERLNKSFNTYTQELNNSERSLNNKSEGYVRRKLRR